jgi:Legume lectin domain
VWTVTIGYNGTNLNVSVQDAANLVDNVIINYPIDVSSFLGTTTAFVGFTSGTGSGFENHDILNWQFADTSTNTPTPEPTSPALLGFGMAAIGVIGARRGR